MVQWSKIPKTCQLFQLCKNMFENSKRICLFCFSILLCPSGEIQVAFPGTTPLRQEQCYPFHFMESIYWNRPFSAGYVLSCGVCCYWPFPHPDEVMDTVDLTRH